MKKQFLQSASMIMLLFLTTGCTLWDQWMGVDEKKPITQTSKQDPINDQTTVMDKKKIPEILSKAKSAHQKTEGLSYQIKGMQKLLNEEGPINHNQISLAGTELKSSDTLHLRGTINEKKNYEVWKAQDTIYEKMTSEWLKRKTSEAKRSPFDTLVILDQAMSTFENIRQTQGLILKEENGNYIVSASSEYLNHSPAIKKQITQYIQEGVQTALNESNSALKLDRVNIKDFKLTYEIDGENYQYYKIKMALSYDYTLNGKNFGIEEEIEKSNKGSFDGKLEIPPEVTNEIKDTNDSPSMIIRA